MHMCIYIYMHVCIEYIVYTTYTCVCVCIYIIYYSSEGKGFPKMKCYSSDGLCEAGVPNFPHTSVTSLLAGEAPPMQRIQLCRERYPGS